MPLGYKKAVEELRGGARLMITHPDLRRPDSKPIYGLLPSGRQVSEAAFRKMKPLLHPCADGLFGAEISQTFEWRES